MKTLSRRNLIRVGATGGASILLSACSPVVRAQGGAGSPTYIDVKRFGAKGDGETDDTKAIQTAIDTVVQVDNLQQAASVFMPPGIYLSNRLQIKSNCALIGVPGYDYEHPGGTVIKLLDPSVSCLIDISGTHGVTLEGLSLDGNQQKGPGVHGIMRNDPVPVVGVQIENVTTIDRCSIGNFSGDGIHMMNSWCWSVRHSYIHGNRLDGISVVGWDCWVADCWLSGNGGCGYRGQGDCCTTFTGNRVEWNQLQGFLAAGGAWGHTIVGNMFDYSFLSAVAAITAAGDSDPTRHITLSGNFFCRSGHVGAVAHSPDSSHVKLIGVSGVTCTGNTMRAGSDNWSLSDPCGPAYGIYYRDLTECVIANNTLHQGALTTLVNGGGGSNNVVNNNPGSLLLTA